MQSVSYFFILGDGHARCLPASYFSSGFKLPTKAESGLRRIDRYEWNLLAKQLLSVNRVVQCLSEAKGRFLLICRNSVRIMAAEPVIDDVQEIVSCFRRDYPDSNDANCFSVGLTFPCFKTTGRCSTEISMLENIDSFNEQNRTDKYIIENNIALDGSEVIG